ncbi:phosphatidylinositol kinase [Aureococcus anophagefferens]|nr:phosphatidylinositol kinase [Aureococcus anophagefferens]
MDGHYDDNEAFVCGLCSSNSQPSTRGEKRALAPSTGVSEASEDESSDSDFDAAPSKPEMSPQYMSVSWNNYHRHWTVFVTASKVGLKRRKGLGNYDEEQLAAHAQDRFWREACRRCSLTRRTSRDQSPTDADIRAFEHMSAADQAAKAERVAKSLKDSAKRDRAANRRQRTSKKQRVSKDDDASDDEGAPVAPRRSSGQSRKQISYAEGGDDDDAVRPAGVWPGGSFDGVAWIATRA